MADHGFSPRPRVPKHKTGHKSSHKTGQKVREAPNIGELAGADTAMVRTLTQEAARRTAFKTAAEGARPRTPTPSLTARITSGIRKLFGL